MKQSFYTLALPPGLATYRESRYVYSYSPRDAGAPVAHWRRAQTAWMPVGEQTLYGLSSQPR